MSLRSCGLPIHLTMCAFFLKHSRHRQSPPALGIGSFTVSSMHQHWPDRSQPNSLPHSAQTSRRGRGTGISVRSVMIAAKL